MDENTDTVRVYLSAMHDAMQRIKPLADRTGSVENIRFKFKAHNEAHAAIMARCIVAANENDAQEQDAVDLLEARNYRYNPGANEAEIDLKFSRAQQKQSWDMAIQSLLDKMQSIYDGTLSMHTAKLGGSPVATDEESAPSQSPKARRKPSPLEAHMAQILNPQDLVIDRVINFLVKLQEKGGKADDITLTFDVSDMSHKEITTLGKTVAYANIRPLVNVLRDGEVEKIRERFKPVYSQEKGTVEITIAPQLLKPEGSWRECIQIMVTCLQEYQSRQNTVKSKKVRGVNDGSPPPKSDQQKKDELAASIEASRNKKAGEVKSASITHLDDALKRMPNSQNLDERYRGQLLEHAITTFAQMLDVRDEEALARTNASDIQKATGAMHRKLADMFLSTDNVRCAAATNNLLRVFTDKAPNWSGPERANKNLAYLSGNEEAKQFLKKASEAIPGLPLLLYAAAQEDPDGASRKYRLSLSERKNPSIDDIIGMEPTLISNAVGSFLEEHAQRKGASYS